MTAIIVSLLIFGGLGAWLGWRRGTAQMYRRSHDPLEPVLASHQTDPEFFARRARRRWIMTVGYAVAGCAIALLFLLVVAR